MKISYRFSRMLAVAVLAFSGTAMLSVSFDAEAQRMGRGGSAGRQSSNVMQQRQATTPPAANTQRQAGQQPAAANSAAGAASQQAARSGASRWLGPLAGIAAGLGLAALFSSLGLGGALAEFLSSALLIALIAFAGLFIWRRLRGASAQRPAAQGAAAGAGASGGAFGQGQFQQQGMWRDAQPAMPAAQPSAPASFSSATPAQAASTSASPAFMSTAAEPAVGQGQDDWYIPADFDVPQFLQHAKSHFVQIQALWDRGDIEQLGDYMTEDLLAEMRHQLEQREGGNHTEVVLLNAELLGIENVPDGYLASVRYSGMLRDAPGAEAFRFEEVWNLYKGDDTGWLLAGIQQLDGEQPN